MSSLLVPCLACHRHVRADAEACPFCFVERAPEERVEAAPEPMPARMGSLAVMTFRAAALGVALNACGGETDKPPKPTAQGGSTAQGGASANSGTGANAGTPPDTATGGSSASGGRSGDGSGGVIQTGGVPNANTGGGPVPIYRATPRG